jgi:hypothetical protein
MQKKKQPNNMRFLLPIIINRVITMFMVDSVRHKCRRYKFDVVGTFLQAKLRRRICIKLPSINGELFPKYAAYCGKPAMFLNAMQVMVLSRKYWYEEFRD